MKISYKFLNEVFETITYINTDKIQLESYQFLESVIEYLCEWEEEVNGIEGLTKDERCRMMLSSQTVMGWRITSKFNNKS